MTVSTYYDGELIGEPMTDLSGEALLRFIEMQMVLKREVRIAPEQAEADANRIIAESITPELIEMTEAQARLEHGWVTVQGADTVVASQE